MNEQECKEKILQLIEDVYNKKYVGHIKVTKLNPIGWGVRLGMNNDDKPIIIDAELPDDKFLKFFRKELLDRDWDCTKYFMGYKNYPDNGCPHDSSCSCND